MKIQEGTMNSLSNSYVTIAEEEELISKKKFQIIFEKANQTRNSFCPVRDIINRISDKWSMLSIIALGGYGKLRFNELKHLIGDVSQRMLTVTLRNLETDGLITRTIYAQVPPKVEYELTELGMSLLQQISLFSDWANQNGEKIIAFRKMAAPIK